MKLQNKTKGDKNKMKKAKVKFNVADDFEAGDCVACPLHAMEGDDYYGEEYRSCQLGYKFSECPIVLEGED